PRPGPARMPWWLAPAWPGGCSAAAGAAGGRPARLSCAPRDGAAAAGRMGDLDPAGLGLGRDGDGQVQDTVGVARGKVLRVHALAQGQLAGERPLGPLGDDDLLALAVVRGAFGPDRQG